MSYKDEDKRKQYHREYYRRHRQQLLARSKKWQLENPEYLHQYQEKNKEKLALYRQRYSRAYYQNHRQESLSRSTQWYKDNTGKAKSNSARQKLERKMNVLTQYGNGRCACVKCGESRLACLSIDHIKASGMRDKISGNQLYCWLIKNNYPQGYQTLCMNCQFIKRVENNEYG